MFKSLILPLMKFANHIKIVIKGYPVKIIHQVKKVIKQIPAISTVNAYYKAKQLKIRRAKLEEYYRLQAEKGGYVYNEHAVIKEFKRRHFRLNPEYIAKKIGELKIFWVGSNKDQDESGFLQALRNTGTVIELNNCMGTYGQWFGDNDCHISLLDEKITKQNDQCILSQIESTQQKGLKLDFLLGQMLANYISVDALSKVHALGLPVINISMDDRLPEHWRSHKLKRLGAIGLSSMTDLVLTTSAETCAWYGIEGCPAIYWPLASSPEFFGLNCKNERDIDVLFIGNKYGVRKDIITALAREGIIVSCYGRGWTNGPVTAEQAISLSNKARIILGIGTVGYCKDVFTLKLRDFDAPMSGALYLTHRNPDLNRFYQEGKEVEYYSTSEECARKIRYYLNNPDDLSKIAQSGYSKAVKYHTWFHRLYTTFSELGLIEV